MTDMDVWTVLVRGTAAADEDESVPGSYRFLVPSGCPAAEAVAAVLDEFHARIGIEELDAFEITVVDPLGVRRIDETPSRYAARFLGRSG